MGLIGRHNVKKACIYKDMCIIWPASYFTVNHIRRYIDGKEIIICKDHYLFVTTKDTALRFIEAGDISFTDDDMYLIPADKIDAIEKELESCNDVDDAHDLLYDKCKRIKATKDLK